MSFDRILISTDGSDLATKGLLKGIELANLLHADITVVTVTEPKPNSMHIDGMNWEPGGSSVVTQAFRDDERAQQILEKARRRVAAAGLACDVIHINDRGTADGIVQAARERRSALIVMASRARNKLVSLLQRSQTRKVLARSPVPVLVVT